MIGKARKYCAPRSVAYPLQLLDVAVDAYARSSYRKRGKEDPNADAPEILLMSSGHLGDALILTYTFPLIRARFPNAKIDVMAGSWCDPIWKDNPYIRRVIHLNHPGTSRRSLTRFGKWRELVQTSRAAINVLRGTVYDYSADIRFSSAPMHFLLPYLNVKRKIGFGTRGFGGLLDEEFFMPDEEVHTFELILTVLRPLGIDIPLRNIEPRFFHPVQTPAELWGKLNRPVPDQKPILIFPESGDEVRMLSLDFWSELATRLLAETDSPLIFAGKKVFTTKLYERVLANNPAAQNRLVAAVDNLNLQDIASFSEQARAAITLDSLPMHLCCLGCPTVSFQQNGMGIQFFPIASQPTLVLHNHPLSRNLTLDRPGFTGQYVTQFDTTTQRRALDWLENL